MTEQTTKGIKWFMRHTKDIIYKVFWQKYCVVLEQNDNLPVAPNSSAKI